MDQQAASARENYRLAEKSLLDLRCDLGQPFFRAVRSMPIMPKVSLEALYTFFGILKLVRELLRYVDCMVVVFCIYLRRLVKEGQNVLPRDVQAIRRIWALCLSRRGERDHRFWFSRGETATARDLTTHDITTSREVRWRWNAKLRSDAISACG